MTIKTFSFSSGDQADRVHGLELIIDRSALPEDMKLSLWLDDDGTEIPGLERVRRDVRGRLTGNPAASCSSFVLLDRARVAANLGSRSGVLTLEKGTRFDAYGGAYQTPMKVRGGAIAVQEGRRLAAIRERQAVLTVDRKPGEVHVFTLVAEKPPSAQPGARYFVEVTQRSGGVVAGAVACEFVFD